MKQTILTAIIVLMSFTVAGAASVPIHVGWDPNTEPDMKEYRVYILTSHQSPIGVVPHPASPPAMIEYQGSVTVPDGTAGFFDLVVTAVDTAGNESGDSNSVRYNYDFVPNVPPGNPKNVRKLP